MAEMNRRQFNYRTSQYHDRWWGYCALHLLPMYRWVEGDQVWKWAFVKPSEGDS